MNADRRGSGNKIVRSGNLDIADIGKTKIGTTEDTENTEDVGRSEKAKTLPRIYADERGSGKIGKTKNYH